MRTAVGVPSDRDGIEQTIVFAGTSAARCRLFVAEPAWEGLAYAAGAEVVCVPLRLSSGDGNPFRDNSCKLSIRLR